MRSQTGDLCTFTTYICKGAPFCKMVPLFLSAFRPWSVDSLNGGLTDVMEKPSKEKKGTKNGSPIKIRKMYSPQNFFLFLIS